MGSELIQALVEDGADFRKVQSSGEVTIPKRLREKHDIEPGQRVVVSDDGGVLTIQKVGGDS